MAPLRPLPTTAVPVLERGAVTVVKAEGYVARLGASNRLLGMPVFYVRQVMESGGTFKNAGKEEGKKERQRGCSDSVCLLAVKPKQCRSK